MHHQSHQPPRRFVDRKGFRFGCLPAMVITWVIFLLTLFTGGDTDNTSGKDDAKATRPTASATTTAPGMDKRQITELSVDMVWDSYNAARRDLMCVGMEVHGPGWFAEQLESDSIDPEYAEDLVTEKCESR
ncbi:hypothetical protein ACFYQA_08325 [Streptomyces sp. NPDC005774]|uniref:hypothetical protein n=1 Tax=Streptomyces sp. NPDC005774 TaxID=3364728 RepID=UPI0036B479BF